MSLGMLIIDAVLLLGIIGVSVYGARALPADARLPLHFGPAGYTNWQPKIFALLLWPAIAVVVYVVVVATQGQHSSSGQKLPLPIVLTVAMVAMLASHYGAVRIAMRRSGHA
jgi:hypothetical protein